MASRGSKTTPCSEGPLPQMQNLSLTTVPNPETSDDFVLVPSTVLMDWPFDDSLSSPLRFSSPSIPISKEPMSSMKDQTGSSRSTDLPIKIVPIDIRNLSPPLQFVLGTPPFSRSLPDSHPMYSKNSPDGLVRVLRPKTEATEDVEDIVDHLQMVVKLDYILSFVRCVVDCVRPSRDVEKLLINQRCLGILDYAISYGLKETTMGKLQSTEDVKKIMTNLRKNSDTILNVTKELNTPTIAQQKPSFDKIIFDYAIKLCEKSVPDMIQCDLAECWNNFLKSHILLHGLAQITDDEHDKAEYIRCRDMVEKRLAFLQERYSSSLNYITPYSNM